MKLPRVIQQVRGRSDRVGGDMRVIFFPTAAEEAGDKWRVPVHGWVFRPAAYSRLRRLDLWLLRHLVSGRAAMEGAAGAIFDQRVGAFLADNKRRQRLTIALAGETFTLGRSRGSGHFGGLIEISARRVGTAAGDGAVGKTIAGRPSWLSFDVPTAGAKGAGGRVMLLPREGLSVISDIDDTIKVTQVKQRRQMLRRTFLEEFASVPEMAEVYQRWAAQGAAFHYVSASPWHLYPFLAEFLARQGFPEGTFHLRDFRLVPGSLHRTLRPSRRIKLKHARELMGRFPGRRFVLVGDSGESDAAIYARLYREFPVQVEKIFIRNITGEGMGDARWGPVFRGVPTGKWRVFEKREEVGAPGLLSQGECVK